jgi:N-acyl-D-aspartate/D-glutamate deacylase
MQYDLLIQNGTIVDGSGMPRFQADVGIVGGKIAAIGKIRDSAKEVIDAEGHVVAPGFIDGHTHMDAQVFWDPLGTCSCWHGITSVVMGNCGFSLAPCSEENKLMVMRNLERAFPGAGLPSQSTSTLSSDCPRALTMPPTWATPPSARTSWVSAPSPTKQMTTT